MLRRMIDPKELLLELRQNRLNQKERETSFERLAARLKTSSYIIILAAGLLVLFVAITFFASTTPWGAKKVVGYYGMLPVFAAPLVWWVQDRQRAMEELVALEAPELYVRLVQRGVLRARRK